MDDDIRKMYTSELEGLRWQYAEKASLIALMAKTTDAIELLKIREEELAPLEARIAELEELLAEPDSGDTDDLDDIDTDEI